MSDYMGKIGDKLHLGGHKKTEPAPDAAHTPVVEQSEAPPPQSGKIGDKLHLGGHKKTAPAPDAAHTPVVDHSEAPPPQEPVVEQGQVHPTRPEAFAEPVKTEPAHASPHSPLDKIKQKLHVGKDKGAGKKDMDVPPPG